MLAQHFKLLGGLGFGTLLGMSLHAAPLDLLRTSDRDLPVEIIPASRIHIPTGFDSNDIVQFVVEVHFPTPCYRLKQIAVSPVEESKEIQFHIEAYRYQEVCPEVMTWAWATAELGFLEAGDYQLRDVKNENLQQEAVTFKIKAAQTAARDDYLYAPARSVEVFCNEGPRALSEKCFVKIRGQLTNSCLSFPKESPMPPVQNNAPSLIEVLPVMELKGENCKDMSEEFTKVYEVPEAIVSGDYLFHVRTMNGNALNQFLNLNRREKADKENP